MEEETTASKDTLENSLVPTQPANLSLTSNAIVPEQTLFSNAGSHDLSGSRMVMIQNVPYSIMSAPFVGPSQQSNSMTLPASVGINHLSGTFDTNYTMDVLDFEIQRRAYSKALANKQLPEGLTKKRKREEKGQVEDLESFKGPWAGFVGETVGVPVGPSEGERAASAAATAISTVPERAILAPGDESSVLHITAEGPNSELLQIDNNNNNDGFMKIPQIINTDLLTAAVPSKIIHTFLGHTKPITALLFFPRTGHLFLSASLDGRIKLWHTARRCVIRTYIGHNKGIKDICFASNGQAFLSCSYDGWVKLWDTESGRVLARYEAESTPVVIRFASMMTSSDSGFANVLIGLGNGKIIQVNLNNGKIVQTYNDHFKSILSIALIDSQRFVSTSEDRTIKVWDIESGRVLKSEHQAFFHVMPSIAIHPSSKWMAFQSLDNSISVYSTKDKYKPHRKRFYGHQLASFHCSIAFSSDSNGRILVSGDGNGALWFWDWETGRIVKKMKGVGGNKPLTVTVWNPQSSSQVLTGGWDGHIRLLE